MSIGATVSAEGTTWVVERCSKCGEIQIVPYSDYQAALHLRDQNTGIHKHFYCRQGHRFHLFNRNEQEVISKIQADKVAMHKAALITAVSQSTEVNDFLDEILNIKATIPADAPA